MKLRMFLCALSICFMALVQTGCTPARDSENVGTTRVTAPVDYKNGIFYFHETQAELGNSLSSFISNHPELELVSIASDNTGGNGTTVGYFAVFINKEKK